MTLLQSHTVASDDEFICRVTAALVRKALEVAVEDDDTPNYINRLRLATDVVNDPQGIGRKAAHVVVNTTEILNKLDSANGAITTSQHVSSLARTITDEEITRAFTDDLWNLYAGSGFRRGELSLDQGQLKRVLDLIEDIWD